MTKEEKIKEAYGKYYDICKPDKSGWSGLSNATDKIRRESGFSWQFMDVDKKHCARPNSLRGIDHNNGWIKIVDFNELPIGFTDCFVYSEGIVKRANLSNDMNSFRYTVENKITHYQTVINPQPPIY